MSRKNIYILPVAQDKLTKIATKLQTSESAAISKMIDEKHDKLFVKKDQDHEYDINNPNYIMP